MEEDLLIRFFRDPQTNEFLIAGAGQPHIEAIVSRLKKRYHAEVTLKAPKVPYRETIRAKVEAAGTPQEADRRPRPIRRLARFAWSRSPAAAGFEFASEVFGGAIPRNFIPAIEKGIVESAARGLSRPASRSSTSRPPLRRQLPRRRLQRNEFQDGRANRV